MTEYIATHRRPGRVAILILLSLVWLVGGVWTAIEPRNEDAVDDIMIIALVGALFGICLALFQGSRRHAWRLGTDGIHIQERPILPLTGLTRRGFVAWPAVAALESSGQNSVAQLHLITDKGERWSITQRAVSSAQSRFQIADPTALLDELEAGIRAQVAQHRPALGPTLRSLAFLETAPGIAVLACGFLMSIVVAGATIWALWEGQRMTTGTRASYDALALFLFGPILTAWGLLASLRRRRAILRARQQSAGHSSQD